VPHAPRNAPAPGKPNHQEEPMPPALARITNPASASTGTGPKQLYRVTEAMEVLSLSRSVIYEQLRSGRLRSVTQGRTRFVPAAAITEYVALLEREATGAPLGVAS
jgi:excisionase family DNA binding protein